MAQDNQSATVLQPYQAIMAASLDRVLVTGLVSRLVGAAARARIAQPLPAVLLFAGSIGPACIALSVRVDSAAWNITVVPTLIFSPLMVLLCWFPLTTWQTLVRDSPQHEELLGCASARVDLARWMEQRLRRIPQLAFLCAATTVSIGVALMVISELHLRPLDCIPYIVSVAFVGALGSNTVWWLIYAPVMTWRLRRRAPLELDWRAPAHTPALAGLRALMITSARRATAGAVIFGVAIVFTVRRAPHSIALQAVALAGLLSSVFVAVFVCVAPQFWLAECVRCTVAAKVAELRATLPLDPGDEFDAATVQLIMFLEGHPTTMWDVKWIAGLFATAVFGLLPYAPLLSG